MATQELEYNTLKTTVALTAGMTAGMTPSSDIDGPSGKPTVQVKFEVEKQEDGRRNLNLWYRPIKSDVDEDEETMTVSVKRLVPRARRVEHKTPMQLNGVCNRYNCGSWKHQNFPKKEESPGRNLDRFLVLLLQLYPTVFHLLDYCYPRSCTWPESVALVAVPLES